MISIIVVTYNSEYDIEFCLNSIFRYTAEPYRLIVIDNASQDSTVDIVRSMGSKIELYCLEKNIGYAPAINKGIDLSQDSEYFVFLNPDTIVTHSWLKRMIDCFQMRSNVGIVGPLSNAVAGYQKVENWLWTNPEMKGIEYEPGVRINVLAQQISASSHNDPMSVKFLSGFCMVTTRNIIVHVGKLDERFFLGIDDLDFSLRVKSAGYDLLVASGVFVYHRGSSSILSYPPKAYRKIHKEMGAYFCSILREKYGTIPSSEELFGFEFFDPIEFDPETPYPEMQWQIRLVSADGETLELLRELA